MKRWLLILLALSILLVGCGDQKAPVDQEPGPEYDPALTIDKCYTYTENENGTYSYEVVARNHETILEDYYIPYPVTITEVSEHVLSLVGQKGTRLTDRWAVFCDVQNAVVYQRICNVVAAGKSQVAFVENRTDQYHLFVCNAVNPSDILLGEPLTGLVVEEGEDPQLTVNYEKSTLTVTYPTADGDKTITCELL